jgi:hypothetical protein
MTTSTGGAALGSGAGSSTDTGGATATATGGRGPGSAGGADGTCVDEMQALCRCPSGALGSQTCVEGQWGPCTGCDEVSGCIEGAPCACPDGGAGLSICPDGGPPACECTVPTAGCPDPYVCTETEFGAFCGDPALSGLPPTCRLDGGCNHVGGTCVLLGGYLACIAPCTP